MCMRAIQTSKVYPVNDKKSNQWSSICYGNHRYFSYNSNIKCVGLTIKCISFKPIHYAINF